MIRLKEILEDARHHLASIEDLAGHDAIRVRDAIDAALGAVNSSTPVEPAAVVDPKRKPAAKKE